MPDWLLYALIGVIVLLVVALGLAIWMLCGAAKMGSDIVTGISRGFMR